MSATPHLDKLRLELQSMGLNDAGTIKDLEKRIKRARKKQEMDLKEEELRKRREEEEKIQFPFRYYLVCDVEGTCLEDSGFEWESEIIEFPVVLIDATKMEIAGTFHRYCKPMLNPKLSDFCKSLTGIKQETVDAADPFDHVLNEFLEWLDGFAQEPYADCIFVTDGVWDLRDFVEKELTYYQLERPKFMKQIVDLRKKFTKFFNVESCNLDSMLAHLGLQFKGRKHSGIDDTKNIASIFLELAKQGCRMEATTNLNKHRIRRAHWSTLRK
ncbi:ribonuclease H-like domain-containing protein [Gorgonomyces haynaldii]|nr:ribonuclease H-like domain-containing protein [Gorgonomyces haynaldii]